MATINLLNIEDYISQRLREVAPNLDIGQGAALRDLLVSPLTIILQPLANEIERVRRSQSLIDIAQLGDEDVDALVANLFITRRKGGVAVGSARVFLSGPTSLTINPGTLFLTRSGLRFFATQKLVATPQTILVDTDTGAFYVDVSVQAEQAGDEYNVVANSLITMVTGSSVVVGVTNPLPMSSGAARETSDALIERAKVAISTRDLVTSTSIRTVLADNFPTIEDINIVGFRDREMLRDILTGRGLYLGGIHWPDPAKVHIGGKVDVYARAPLLQDRVEIQNPDLFNRIALFVSDPILDSGAQNTLFECPTCFEVQSPIANIDQVTEVDSQGQQVRELVEGEDFIVYPDVPAEDLSTRARTFIQFVQGSCTMEQARLIGINKFSQNISVLTRFNEMLVAPNGTNLVKNEIPNTSFGDIVIDGETSADVLGYSVISGDQVRFGQGSLFMNGASVSEVFSQPLPYSVRSENRNSVTGANGLTVMGWAYAKSFGQRVDSVTTGARIGTICSYGDSVSLFLSDDGRLNVQLWTENIRRPVIIRSVNPFIGDGQLNKWFFWALTYDGIRRRRLLAQFADGSYGIHNALNVLFDDSDTARQSGKIRVPREQYWHVGSDGNYLRTWDGYIDEMAIVDEVVDNGTLSTIYARSSLLQFSGLQKSAFSADSPLGQVTLIDKDSLIGEHIMMQTGDARGGRFQIVGNDIYSDPLVEATCLIQEVKDGGGRIADIRSGDSFVFLSGLEGDSYIQAGRNILLDYSYAPAVVTLQEFLDRESNRVVVCDPLVKSFSPVRVSFTMKYTKKIGSTITDAQLRSELVKYIEKIKMGDTLDVSDLVDTAYRAGADYVQLPMVVNIDYRTVEGRFVRAAIRDRFNAERLQAFEVLTPDDDIEIVEIGRVA